MYAFSRKRQGEIIFFVSKLSLSVFVFVVFLRMLRRKAGDFLGKEGENVEKVEHFSRGVVKVKKKRKAIRNALRARTCTQPIFRFLPSPFTYPVKRLCLRGLWVNTKAVFTFTHRVSCCFTVGWVGFFTPKGVKRKG